MSERTDSDRLTSLEGQVATLIANHASLSADLRRIDEKLGGIGKINWPLIVAIVGALMAIAAPSAAVVGVFMTYQVQGATAELKSQYIAPLTSSAEISKRDRQELHNSISDLSRLTGEVNARDRETTAEHRAAIVELESQVRATSQIANLHRSYQQQLTAIIWQQAFGYAMPESNYFTDITLPKPQQAP